jgi:uncharacterized protein (TIGR02284 family)
MAKNNAFSGSNVSGSSNVSGTSGGAAAARDRDKMIEVLNDLLIVDNNAVGLYDKVLEKLDRDDLRSQVESFRGDHQRHIRDLSQAVRGLGGTPRNDTSFVGPMAKTFTSVTAALMGNKGALQGLMQGEEYTTSNYDKVNLDLFSEDIRSIIMRNRDDEHRHLQWVKDALKRI